MPKVVFVFEGTTRVNELQKGLEETIRLADQWEDDVVVVYMEGCQRKEIGKSIFNPDLTVGANYLVESFNENGELSRDLLYAKFNGAIANIIDKHNLLDTPFKPESMALAGFSRGGVSVAIAAKALAAKENTQDIPLDLIIDQGVPGNTFKYEGSNLKSAESLEECKNVRSAAVFLGDYENTTLFINAFFRQMIPVFHQLSRVKVWRLPLYSHFLNEVVSLAHHAIVLAEQGYIKNPSEAIEHFKDIIKQQYKTIHKFTLAP